MDLGIPGNLSEGTSRAGESRTTLKEHFSIPRIIVPSLLIETPKVVPSNALFAE
jgi:hypothetical protein